MEVRFKNYKSLRKWLKERTDKEFFLTNTKDNCITCVICRDNKLKTWEQSYAYMAWFNLRHAEEILEFINQE